MRTHAEIRRSSLVALAATATSLVLASSAAAAPAPGGGASEAVTVRHSAGQGAVAKKVGNTRLVVKVRNCAKCRVTLISAPRPPEGDAAPDIWTSRDVRVKRGKVSFRVPAAHAEGLYLTVWDPRAVSTGAMPMAVARYKGQRVGKKVRPGKAARAKRGFHCVAAPTKAKVVWKLRVDRFPGRDMVTNRKGYQIRPYLSPTQESFGDSMRLYRGVAAAQDVAFCQRTP